MKVKQLEVLLFVNDVETCRDFWVEKVGYGVAEHMRGPQGSTMYSLRGTADGTALVLADRAVVESTDPQLDTGAPYLVLTVDDLTATHAELADRDVQVSDIFEMEGVRTFNFYDCEGNSFAVV